MSGQLSRSRCQIGIASLLIGVAILGCTKGPFWRTGYLAPWARQQWADEERVAASFLTRRAEMQDLVQAAKRGSPSDQLGAAEQLAQVAQNDPIILVRAEAVRLLGELDHPTAHQALAQAAQDARSEIRLAAVHACAASQSPESVPVLQQVIGADTDIDIRLAATRALQHHRGPQVVQALGLALEDSDPALQIRAVEALRIVTGERLGDDISAWRQFVRSTAPRPDAEPPSQVDERPVQASAIMR
jgi:HEAT repeat protein